MSFCFNFSDDENDDTLSHHSAEVEVIHKTLTSSKLKAEASDLITQSGEFDPVKDALFEQHQQNRVSQHTEYTDVIHGVYEGGLKLWECSDDLLQYLSQDVGQEEFVGRRVIDLGCGHGHPGIWCVSRGSALTCFQDLNTDALRQATVPNVLRICGSDCIIKKDQENKGEATAVNADGTASSSQADDLARLHALMNKKVAAKKTAQLASNGDTLQYEKIKALVLSGQETDPEMIQWVLEMEEELFGEDDGEDATADQDDEDDDEDDEVLVDDGEDEETKQKKLSAVLKSNVVLNTGYSTADYTLTPHATFIYGPWGYYDLENASMVNNHHALLEQAPVTIPALNDSAAVAFTTTVAEDVIRHYNGYTADSKKYTTTIALTTTAQQPQFTQHPTTTTLTDLLSKLSLDTPAQVVTTQLTITPSIVTVDDITVPEGAEREVVASAVKSMFELITVLSNTINTAYTQALQTYRQQVLVNKQYQYPYLTPTVDYVDENGKSFPFTTVITTTLRTAAQRALFAVLTGLKFYEASWTKVGDAMQGEEKAAEAVEQVDIVMSLPLTNTNITTPALTTTQPTIPQLEQSLGYIYTNNNTNKKTKKANALWYGSHPLDSPYRYDMILSSDTIYSSPTMPTLIQTLRSMLGRKGKAFIAAKRYYFGVGGGTPEFCQHIDTYCPDMKITSIKQFINGASNIREILLLEWKEEVVEKVW